MELCLESEHQLLEVGQDLVLFLLRVFARAQLPKHTRHRAHALADFAQGLEQPAQLDHLVAQTPLPVGQPLDQPAERGREIVGAFAESPGVIALGAELLRYQAGVFLAWAIFFVLMRALQGAGDVLVPMLISLLNSVLVTLPLGLWLASDGGMGLGVTGIFQASLVGAVTVTAAMGLWFATGRWQRGPSAAFRPRG